MPAIADLLPNSRLAAIRSHMSKPEFKVKVKTAIADIREFITHEGVNQEVPLTAWGSYGKDSMAMWLLCELAEIDYYPAFINNALELPQHYTVVEEFDAWLGRGEATTYNTEYRGIDYLELSLWHCRRKREEKQQQWEEKRSQSKEGQTMKAISNKPPLTFFDPQEAYDLFYSFVIGEFHWDHIGDDRNTLHMWGTRASEGMGRQWELSKNGKLFQPGFSLKKSEIPIWRGLPIGDWSDMDVWAFLMNMEAPVSPIYGMNEISQRGQGRNYWARTLWYCDPHIFSPHFAKWLKKYAPAQLSEVIERFPEVKERLSKKKAAA
jgi:3'-phosphoadenosine 5'-phosphosulfate sulfotransferase (PAPS reductase)/FAD synthetase